MAAWLTQPLQLHSSRAFNCEGFNAADCAYYRQRWHFWYEADHVFALPTIAFFMCAIGMFVAVYAVSLVLGSPNKQHHQGLRRPLAAFRYLSYRAFRLDSIQWNSAPIGLLLLAVIGIVYFFCMDLVPQPYYWPDLGWGGSPPLGTRSGWMALACMPFVFATASKVNWITLVTGVTHEKLQVFHRWISYAFFVLALMHTFPFIVYHVRHHDMVEQVTSGLVFYWTGIVALVLQAWLTIASFSTIRNLNYELFKALHFLAAGLFVLIFFWHCDYTLSSWDYFIAAAAIYIPCLLYPWARTIFEYGGSQKAYIHVEETNKNSFIRITVPAKFDWIPGQHCFLRFRSFGIANALTSHPFTICSLPSATREEQSQLIFYVRLRGGFTKRFYEHALKRPGVPVPVYVDGPYGGISPGKFHGADRAIVIAGGSGAGWTLPFIEEFVRGRGRLRAVGTGNSAGGEKIVVARGVDEAVDERQLAIAGRTPSSLRVILATRDIETRDWYHRTVKELLSPYTTTSLSSDLDIQVYLTGEARFQSKQHPPKTTTETSKSSSSASDSTSSAEHAVLPTTVTPSANHSYATDRDGRPNLGPIINFECNRLSYHPPLAQPSSLAIFACGPSSMAHDVQNAVAQANLGILRDGVGAAVATSQGEGTSVSEVYLHLEHFEWA